MLVFKYGIVCGGRYSDCQEDNEATEDLHVPQNSRPAARKTKEQ